MDSTTRKENKRNKHNDNDENGVNFGNYIKGRSAKQVATYNSTITLILG